MKTGTILFLIAFGIVAYIIYKKLFKKQVQTIAVLARLPAVKI